MDTMNMAYKPNQILPREGMCTYEPCVTQKRCRNPQPTYQRGIGAIHIQNCVLTWKVRAHTGPSSTWKGASQRRKEMQWMHAIYNAISTNMQWNGYLQHAVTMQCNATYWGKCNGCMQATKEMQWQCTKMQWLWLQLSLSYQQGDILGWFSIQNWGVAMPPQPMGLTYRFQAEGKPLGT